VTQLTNRERQVLELIAAGGTTKTMAVALGISAPTVKLHVANAAKKLGARSRSEAVVIALERGYIRSRRERSSR
jgi:DNA-binding CsgD family transcriptional regulator